MNSLMQLSLNTFEAVEESRKRDFINLVVQIKELKIIVTHSLIYELISKLRSESTRSHENVPIFQNISSRMGEGISY